MARKYWNQSERYGGREQVTIEDYRELNPDGDFIETTRDGQPVIEEYMTHNVYTVNECEVIATQKRNG